MYTCNQGRIQGGGGGVGFGAEAPPPPPPPPFIFRLYLINMLSIIMKFCLSIISMITKNHLINIFPKYYQWIYAKVYATRTRISIGGVQDRDTLIEQSANYSNRTFTGWFCYGIFPNLPAPIHTMKCIGLFKGLHSSTCIRS